MPNVCRGCRIPCVMHVGQEIHRSPYARHDGEHSYSRYMGGVGGTDGGRSGKGHGNRDEVGAMDG